MDVFLDLVPGNEEALKLPLDAHEQHPVLPVHVLVQIDDIAAVVGDELGDFGDDALTVRAVEQYDSGRFHVLTVNDMDVPLRERYLDAGLIQGLVNDFTGAGKVGIALGNEDELLDCDIDGVVAEILDCHIDSELLVDYLQSGIVSVLKRLHGLHEHLAGLFDVGAIFHSHDDLGEFVRIASREILEILVEERSIEE